MEKITQDNEEFKERDYKQIVLQEDYPCITCNELILESKAIRVLKRLDYFTFDSCFKGQVELRCPECFESLDEEEVGVIDVSDRVVDSIEEKLSNASIEFLKALEESNKQLNKFKIKPPESFL